jgi:quercetin dioxygenase-like cupin family protein
MGNTAQAAWWGGAARRVAAGLLTARVNSIAPRQPAHPQEEQALSGRVIDNPVSGERIIIRETGEQTGGRLLSFDLFLPPGAHVPARHVHPVQEERFTVIEGRMRFRVGRRTILANPGDTIPVPAGTAHWFGNIGAGVSHARVEVRPALRMEELFETAAAIGRAGHFPGTRMPRLSDLALFLNEFQRELAVPDVPAFLVRGLLAPFAWMGRRRPLDVKPGSAR